MLAGHGGLQGVNDALEDSQKDGRNAQHFYLYRQKERAARICRGGAGGGTARHSTKWATEMEAVL